MTGQMTVEEVIADIEREVYLPLHGVWPLDDEPHQTYATRAEALNEEGASDYWKLRLPEAPRG